MSTSKNSSGPPGSSLVGFAIFGLCTIGVAAAILAIVAVSVNTGSDFVGAGVLLIASAISFGLLLGALLRS